MVIASVLIAVVLPLAILTAPAQEKNTAIETNMFADPMDSPGDYYLLAEVAEVERVKIVLWNPESKGISKFLEKGSQWEFDADTHIIKIKVPIDDGQQRILVYAKQIVPWQFKAQKSLMKDSVKILIGDRICEKNKDFFCDETKGIITVKPELCKNNPPSLIIYFFDDPNSLPERYTQGSRDKNGDLIKKDVFDPKIENKFMGFPEDFKRNPGLIGNIAQSTGDPLVYITGQSLESRNHICIDWLFFTAKAIVRTKKKGKDYTYNSEKSIIAFTGKAPLDPDQGEFVTVWGVPIPDLFFIRASCRKRLNRS